MDSSKKEARSKLSDPDIEIKDVLAELHREFHKRRDHIFTSLKTYAVFCGISVGWVVTAKTLEVIPRAFLIALVTFFSVVGVYKGIGVSKSQSNTAKVIVKINQDIGLFYRYFPAEWKKWGERREYWYVWGFAGLGVVTSLVIAFYKPDITPLAKPWFI